MRAETLGPVATAQTLSSPLVITAAEPATQAGQEIVVAEGQKLRFALDAVSPQAGPLHCVWLLNGQEQARGRSWTYQPQFDEGGPMLKDVTGRVTDGANHTAERRWRVRVHEVNRPPTITVAFPPVETLVIAAGEEQPFAVEAADPDTGDRLAYVWVLDGRQVARGPRWRFRAPSAPPSQPYHRLTVKVSDARGLEQRRGWNLVVKRPLLPPRVMETQPSEVVVLPSLRLSEGGDAEERRKEQKARTQLAQMGVSWSGTALIESAAKGDTRAVELFLTAGMSPNAQDESGGTPLMAAAMTDHTALLQVLLDRGADVNTKDAEGWTALMYAAWTGHTAATEVLLDRGTDVNTKDAEGWTALMYAAWTGHTAVVQALLHGGADANATNNAAETVLMAAARQDDTKIVHLLKQAGARE
jgi:hypothetical protein